MLLVQNFLDGDERDLSLSSLPERGALGLGVVGVGERDEEAAGAVFSLHDGLEGVDVGAADLVCLFDLHGEPVAREHACAGEAGLVLGGLRVVLGLGADGEDAPVDAHVADLNLVGDAAEGNGGPVLELEGGDGLEFVDGPRQVGVGRKR